MSHSLKYGPLAIAIGFALSSTAWAANEQSDDQQQSEEATTVVIVGSRAAPRSVTDSPVPVDVISADEMLATGTPDMNSILSTVVPSYNVNAQPISDAATLVRPANLRGLPPDNTLVLVNGKRRHRSAVITFLGGGVSDGAQGPDISVIPGIALKQVEVLRDGAAAQYGSDAIAGVINFQLRDDASGKTFQVRYGEFYEGDGETIRYSGNVGLPLSDRGFANFSFEYKEVNPTSRSVQRDDAAALIAAGNTDVANPAQIWGTPDVKNDFTLFGNFGLDLGDGKEAYMFGNWSERTVEGGFFFRNPNTRGGVFSADGGQTLLIGDLDGVGTGGTCPVVTITNNVPDPVALAQVFADPNCFTFQEMFPGGFTPRFGGDVTDVSISMGTRGEFNDGTSYDFSATIGRNQVDFFIKNTVNASLGPDTPTSFKPGSYIQLEKTFNADFSKDYEIKGWHDVFVFSYGLEFREESFQIINGDPASFEVGPLAEQGFGIGSNGFPGFKPQDAGVFTRRNYALYLDGETNVTDNLLLGAALRYEDFYTDFGDTLDGKLTFRYDINDEWKMRGSVSTGFRAPTVGQANVRNVTTQFVPGQGLSDQATLPPTNPIAVQKGGKQLQPEESVAYTLGFAAELGDVYATLDFYHIEVTDRIGQVSPQPLTPADIAALEALGIRDASSFSSVTFFANAFDTTTTGVDFVLNYSNEAFGGKNDFSFVANYNKTEVDRFDPNVISQTRIRQLEENLPKVRSTITWTHRRDKWDALLRVNYYGSYYEAHLDAGSLPINAGAEVTVDAEWSYQLTGTTRVKIGAQNIFDEYPDENPWSGVAGAKYPPTSPMGFNGGFWYVELEWNLD